MKKTVGLLGFGAFGRFMARHLAPHFAVRAWNRTPWTPAPGLDATPATFEDAAACELVVIAVTMNGFEAVTRRVASLARPGALVMDVASVKAKPVEVMRRLLPERVDVLGLHPMFGPQSGADGIAGLKCALCPVRLPAERLERVRAFLAQTLELSTLILTPEEHDREMAKVQAVTHFISRGLKELDLGPSPLATKAYEQLQRFSSTLLSDSWELFLTIENENPHAKAMRGRLLDALRDLELRLAERDETP